MRILSLFGVAVLAAACTTPTSGTYVLTPGEVQTDCPEVEDTGGTDSTAEEDDTIAIKVAEDGASMTFGDAQPDVEGYSNTCTLDGTEFVCNMLNSEEDDGTGTIIKLAMSVDGSWSSSTTIEGTGHTAISCTGDGCETYESYGLAFCSSDAAFTGELQEE